MILKILRAVPAFFRMAMTCSLLSVSLFTRYKMGSDAYAPWTSKPHGTGEGMNNPPIWWMILGPVLTFVYVRLFMSWSIAKNSSRFDLSKGSEIWDWLSSPIDLWIYSNEAHAPGDGSSFFFWLSYMIVLMALVHGIMFLLGDGEGQRPYADSLGRSVFGFWWNDERWQERDMIILGIAEPFALFTAAVIFYLIGWKIYALFFLLPAVVQVASVAISREKKLRQQINDAIEERNDESKTVEDSGSQQERKVPVLGKRTYDSKDAPKKKSWFDFKGLFSGKNR